VTIERDDLVRLRAEPTTVGVVATVAGDRVWVTWLFRQVAASQWQADVEVVGRYSGSQ
jgi:hypothetical protein